MRKLKIRKQEFFWIVRESMDRTPLPRSISPAPSGIQAIFTTCLLHSSLFLQDWFGCLLLRHAAQRGCLMGMLYFVSRSYSGPVVGSLRRSVTSGLCFLDEHGVFLLVRWWRALSSFGANWLQPFCNQGGSFWTEL